MFAATEQEHPVLFQKNTMVPPHDQKYISQGISETDMDTTTLSLVETVIPGGREVLAHLLCHATEKANLEAIVLIKNVEALAHLPNSPFRSPDAYSRRLIALETLQVISRKCHRTCTEVRVHMGKISVHMPSLLAALSKMHEAYNDKKVKQFARKLLKRVQSDDFQSSLALSNSHSDADLMPVLHILNALFQAHGVQQDQSRLVMTCEIIARLLHPEKYGRVHENRDAFLTSFPFSHMSSSRVEDVFVNKMDELPEEHMRNPKDKNDAFRAHNSPSETSNHQGKPPYASQLDQKGEPGSPFIAKTGRVLSQGGEFAPSVSFSDSSLSSSLFQKRESLNDQPHQNDLKQGEIESSLYRDSRPMGEIRRDAQRYADLFDGVGNYRWIGKLVTCIQCYPEAIRHLALIDTLFHSWFPDWRGKPRSRGAWFCKAAERFASGSSIPHEVQVWAETGLSYQTIEEALKQGQRVPIDVLTPVVPIADEPPEEHSWELSQLESRVSRRVGMSKTLSCTGVQQSMTKEQAEKLCVHIAREGSPYSIHARVCPGPQGSALVVTLWDDVEEWHTNASEWERYFSEVKACLV